MSEASGSTEVAARAANGVSEQDRLPTGLCGRVGLKGAVARTKTGDAKTTGANNVSDEDRSEPIESSRLGL